MPTEVWRAGDYRVCPKCGSRNKVQDLHCTRCRAVLAGRPAQHASTAAAPSPARSSRGLRALLAVGLLLAIGAGLWVRSLFHGAPIQDSVEASSASTATAPAPQPTWTPPVLSYPPVVGYNAGVPPSMAALAVQGAPSTSSDASAGMVSIAPPTTPTSKTAFSNEDLERTRGGYAGTAGPTAAGSAGAVSAPPVTTTRPSSMEAPAPRSEVSDDEVREWISKIHDREDDVHEAQAKVRRLEAEAEARRAHAAAVAADPGTHDKAQKDVMDALDDLEKAERKLAGKQRDLDEVRQSARAAGVRLER